MSGTKGKELYAPYQEERETHRAARPPTYPKPEKGTGHFSMILFNNRQPLFLEPLIEWKRKMANYVLRPDVNENCFFMIFIFCLIFVLMVQNGKPDFERDGFC